MVWTNNIPLSTDDPSVSQGQFLGNMQAATTVVAVNHVGFNESGQGKHTFLQMPEQVSAPTTAANEGGLYTKEGPDSGVTELFFRRESDGAEIQLTGDFDPVTNGEIVFPGGLIMKWGTVTGVLNPIAVVYTTPFPTATLNVQLTAASSSGLGSENTAVVSSSTLTAAGFSFRKDPAISNPTYWLAIGH